MIAAKLNVKAFSMAFGIYSALSTFALDLYAMFSEYAQHHFGIYITVPGLFIDIIIGFLDGMLAGLIVSWSYNTLLNKLIHKK